MAQDETADGDVRIGAHDEGGAALARLLWRVEASIGAARSERRTRRALRELDRRLLEDIGVAPPDRPRAATRPPGVGDAVLALISEYGRAGRRARGVTAPGDDRR